MLNRLIHPADHNLNRTIAESTLSAEEMHSKLDSIDVNILEGLAQYGPRNIANVAKKLGIPRGTVLSRIKYMSSSYYLRLLTTVYHTNLGLKKAVVFAEAASGQEDLLLNCMKINKYYIYLSRSFGRYEGCVGVYVVPAERTSEFRDFLAELKRTDVAKNVSVMWSTCFHTVNRTSRWFDKSAQSWAFLWDEWLREIPAEEDELPYTLIDPDRFVQKADETDLFIIKELEKDATASLTEIAKKLNTTLQNVHYHYEKHVVKKGLIETFQIAILPFDRATSDMLFFIFRFDSSEKMAKFAASLLDKPFVVIVGKILTQNAILTQVYLPRSEFRNFIDALSSLARDDFIKSYEYVFQDLRVGKWSRETIPYQLFKNGSWVYNHNEQIRNLNDLVQSVDHSKTAQERIFQAEKPEIIGN